MNDRTPQRRLHRLRPQVYARVNHGFAVTICALRGTRPFIEDRLAREVIDSLLWTRQRYRWRLFAYCLMPDHLHLVGRLTSERTYTVNHGRRGVGPVGVLEHIARFKSYTTRQANLQGLVGRLWQKSSYDQLFEDEPAVLAMAEYILQNPVRAKFVEDWRQWPYSGRPDPL